MNKTTLIKILLPLAIVGIGYPLFQYFKEKYDYQTCVADPRHKNYDGNEMYKACGTP